MEARMKNSHRRLASFICARARSTAAVRASMAARARPSRPESENRLFAVGAWRDAPYFKDAERAAPALMEAVRRVSNRSDPAPNEVWNEASRHYDEKGPAILVLSIATTNFFNRLNVPTRQVAGVWNAKWVH